MGSKEDIVQQLARTKKTIFFKDNEGDFVFGKIRHVVPCDSSEFLFFLEGCRGGYYLKDIGEIYQGIEEDNEKLLFEKLQKLVQHDHSADCIYLQIERILMFLYYQNQTRHKAFCYAMLREDYSEMSDLLSQGFDINGDFGLSLPLHFTNELSHDMDWHVYTDVKKCNPLTYAVKTGNEKLVYFLLFHDDCVSSYSIETINKARSLAIYNLLGNMVEFCKRYRILELLLIRFDNNGQLGYLYFIEIFLYYPHRLRRFSDEDINKIEKLANLVLSYYDIKVEKKYIERMINENYPSNLINLAKKYVADSNSNIKQRAVGFWKKRSLPASFDKWVSDNTSNMNITTLAAWISQGEGAEIVRTNFWLVNSRIKLDYKLFKIGCLAGFLLYYHQTGSLFFAGNLKWLNSIFAQEQKPHLSYIEKTRVLAHEPSEEDSTSPVACSSYL